MIQEQVVRIPTLVADAGQSPKAGTEVRPGALSILTGNATLMAWLVFLGLGGAFLTSYYAHIQYFPVLDWKESFSYLAAVLILGGGVAVVYGLLLYFPGVIWSEFLISDTELEDHLCYSGANGMEPCYWRIGKHLVIPFAVFMTAVHLAMLSGEILMVGVVMIVGLGLISPFSWRMFRTILRARDEKRTQAAERWLLLKYVMTVDLAASSSAVSLLFLYSIVDQGHSGWLLAVCTVLVTLSNLLVAVQFRNRPKRAAVTAVMATLVLLVAAEFTNPLSVKIMRRFGLGAEDGTLVVSPKGAEILKGAAGFDCKPQGETAILQHIQILSRLGSEYLLRSGARQATIPKSEFLSWSPQAGQR